MEKLKASLKPLIQVVLYAPILILCAVIPKRRTSFMFGTTPIKSNAYWARALRENGLPAVTLMSDHYPINSREDFDLYFEDFAPAWMPLTVRRVLGRCGALLYVFRNAAVVHQPFSGFVLADTVLWRWEAWLLRWSGVKTVVIPYGWDAYISHQIMDTSLRHALLLSYPRTALRESAVSKLVRYWTVHADCVVCGLMVDGMGRWDIATPSPFVIDLKAWTAKRSYSDHNGINGPVKVIHTPNHRGFKGTEFLVAAVETLRKEGLRVELDLLEKVSNAEVCEHMAEADILAEQFIATGYALSGIEGMACGLPVMANLESKEYACLYRRYSFLGECPVVSTTPESILDVLRVLVTNPRLRQEVGTAGRAYADKYHSYSAAQHLFGSIYRKFAGEDVDLMNLYHPLKFASGQDTAVVSHPLIESRIPQSYLGHAHESR